MNRRHFSRALMAGTALAAIGSSIAIAKNAVAGEITAAPSFEASFENALHASPGEPWLMGYEGLQADVAPMPLTVRGKFPIDLHGAFIRNGPARHSLGGQRYHHWFDGDGMLQKYEIGERGMTHRGRFLRTDKFLADSAAGHPVRDAFGTNVPDAEPITGPDSMNVANTSVVSHGGEMMALWEGGSATRVDPASLDTIGFKTWRDDYKGMPFSAHPKIEPDGTMWNFGVSSGPSVISIYRIAANGSLMSASSLKVPEVSMVHDFAVTEGHLVFLMPPLVFDLDRAKAGATFLDSHVWKPQLGMRVMVLDKNRLDKPIWFELPAGFVFHFGNAWEDTAAQTIRLDYVRTPDASGATVGFQEIMRGRYLDTPHPHVTLVELDLRGGRARQTVLDAVGEFPRVDPRVVGRRYEQVFAASRTDKLGNRPGFDAIMRVNTRTGRIDSYGYGSEMMVEEHVFVPRGGARTASSGREGDGWLVGTALDLKRRAMLLSVFDATNLAAGPVAQASMARVMPLGLHAIFVAA
ncbi:MAG: Carotenoid oxygenase [Rhizobacter sp.]|nr:Carotenoid oxygenase [Rhizobacter sp.]